MCSRVRAMDRDEQIFLARCADIIDSAKCMAEHVKCSEDVEIKRISVSVFLAELQFCEDLFDKWDRLELPQKDDAFIRFVSLRGLTCEINDKIDELKTKRKYYQLTKREIGQNLNKAKLRKQSPLIKQRKAILRASTFDFDAIIKSRKEADAAAEDFAALCEKQGLKRVSGKQLQRYARDILSERRESSGHS
jgi:hypothetical protein